MPAHHSKIRLDCVWNAQSAPGISRRWCPLTSTRGKAWSYQAYGQARRDLRASSSSTPIARRRAFRVYSSVDAATVQPQAVMTWAIVRLGSRAVGRCRRKNCRATPQRAPRVPRAAHAAHAATSCRTQCAGKTAAGTPIARLIVYSRRWQASLPCPWCGARVRPASKRRRASLGATRDAVLVSSGRGYYRTLVRYVVVYVYSITAVQ